MLPVCSVNHRSDLSEDFLCGPIALGSRSHRRPAAGDRWAITDSKPMVFEIPGSPGGDCNAGLSIVESLWDTLDTLATGTVFEACQGRSTSCSRRNLGRSDGMHGWRCVRIFAPQEWMGADEDDGLHTAHLGAACWREAQLTRQILTGASACSSGRGGGDGLM